MADEAKAPAAPAGGSKKMMRTVGMIAGVVIVAAVGGLAAYYFVLAPMLAGDAEAAAPVVADAIPITAVEVSFDTTFVNLIMTSEDMPTSTLLFSLTLSCANQATADIITAHKARFSVIIIKLHDGRTRAEVVSDPRVLKESIQKQVVQEANRLLERLGGASSVDGEDGEGPLQVLDALHTQFAVSDNI